MMMFSFLVLVDLQGDVVIIATGELLKLTLNAMQADKLWSKENVTFYIFSWFWLKFSCWLQWSNQLKSNTPIDQPSKPNQKWNENVKAGVTRTEPSVAPQSFACSTHKMNVTAIKGGGLKCVLWFLMTWMLKGMLTPGGQAVQRWRLETFFKGVAKKV